MEQSIVMEERVVEEKKSKKGIYILVGIIAVVTLVSYIAVSSFNSKYIYNGKISDNVYIQGVNVSGLTMDEAKTLISSEHVPKELTMTYENNKFNIQPSEIDFNYDIDGAVKQAYNFNKTDSYFKNLTRVISLKQGNKEDFKLKSLYSEQKLTESIEKIAKEVNTDVMDAKLHISGSGAMSIDPAKIGKKVSIKDSESLAKKSLNEKDFAAIGLVVNETQPKITTDMVSTVNSVLARHSTEYRNSSAGRANNIERSANSTSDILLMPGEEFSYNTHTGPRTKSNGYQNAPVIVNGKVEDGVGGGVCQVSTTIYNAVLNSGLDITQVRNHSLPSSYAEMGKDATVADGYLDLKFKNPYDTPIYIKNTTYNEVVTSTIYGNASNKKNIGIRVEKIGQNTVKTYRETKDSSGNVINSEFIATSTYKRK